MLTLTLLLIYSCSLGATIAIKKEEENLLNNWLKIVAFFICMPFIFMFCVGQWTIENEDFLSNKKSNL